MTKTNATMITAIFAGIIAIIVKVYLTNPRLMPCAAIATISSSVKKIDTNPAKETPQR